MEETTKQMYDDIMKVVPNMPMENKGIIYLYFGRDILKRSELEKLIQIADKYNREFYISFVFNAILFSKELKHYV